MSIVAVLEANKPCCTVAGRLLCAGKQTAAVFALLPRLDPRNPAEKRRLLFTGIPYCPPSTLKLKKSFGMRRALTETQLPFDGGQFSSLPSLLELHV